MRRVLVAVLTVVLLTALVPGAAAAPDYKGPVLFKDPVWWPNRALCVKPTAFYLWAVYAKQDLGIDSFRSSMTKPSGTVMRLTAKHQFDEGIYDIYTPLSGHKGSFYLGAKWHTKALRNDKIVWKTTNKFTKC